MRKKYYNYINYILKDKTLIMFFRKNNKNKNYFYYFFPKKTLTKIN